MKNKVVALSPDNLNLLSKLEYALAKLGYIDFSFEVLDCLEKFEESCQNAKNVSEYVVAICKNEFIDGVLQKLAGTQDEMSLIKEQAVKVEFENASKFLFLPSEVDFEEFLKDFLQKKPINCCSIFGKSQLAVKEKFSSSGANFKIFSKSDFLHTVFYDKEVDLIDFSASVYAFEDKPISFVCHKILKDKNLSIKIVDSITGGKMCACLNEKEKCQNLKENFLLDCDEDFEKFGITKQFLDEKGVVCKDTVFALAKSVLEDTEIALCAVGYDCDAGRSFVAVGNKSQIHIFSSVFYGDRTQILQNLCDFACWRLLCFLKENY